MDFDPDNPQVWFTCVVLGELLEAFDEVHDKLPWIDVRYIAQDSTGLWWAYSHKPYFNPEDHQGTDGPFDGAWAVDHELNKHACMRCLGMAVLHEYWDKRYYEVNHDL